MVVPLVHFRSEAALNSVAGRSESGPYRDVLTVAFIRLPSGWPQGSRMMRGMGAGFGRARSPSGPHSASVAAAHGKPNGME